MIMKKSNRKKKAIQLILVIIGLSFAIPYVMTKTNFCSPTYAVSTNSASNNDTNHSSNSKNTIALAATTAPTIAASSSTPSANQRGTSGPVSYADAVALAAPSVVSIKTTKKIPIEQNPMMQDPFFRHFFGEGPHGMEHMPRGGDGAAPEEVQQGLGSGVIVSDQGYILTSNHVIREVDTVLITLADGRTSEAKVIGTDPDTDLAVIKINLDKLPVIPMGSSSKLRAGDVVLAIGNPFGFDKTVTQGIVSALDRAGTEIGIIENLIQTDAAINPGNSGGALIDATGRLIGINTVIYTRSGGYQGIGFAIPIDQAIEVMNTLIQGGKISRGYLGVTMQSLTQEIRDHINYKEKDGAYVRAILRDSPAQKAGLLPGDVITKINNTAIKDANDAKRLVANLKAGKSYIFEIFRKNEYMTFTVLLGDRKQAVAEYGSKGQQDKGRQ